MTPTKFIDYKMAIGMLALSGVQVKFDKIKEVLTDEIGNPICYCFRDGTTFKAREETIQDFIESVELAR